MILADKNSCTGCGACESMCMNKAIELIQDEEGFYRPCIDENKCIECGACKKVCPAFKTYENTFNYSVFYAVSSKNSADIKTASSGGAFGKIAEWIIKNGGVVFGAAFDDDFRILSHKSTDEVSLSKLKKSKYLESKMNCIIEKIRHELKKDRWVLFCGTPCQVQGIRAACGYEYKKLILIDFLCFGVPSQKAYEKYIDDIEKKYKSKVKEIDFRSKKLGWRTYCMFITFENGKKYLKTGIEDPYFKLFFSRLSLKNACYNCERISKSVADITLGDFWGANRVRELADKDEGISLVLLHNDSGEYIFEMIKPEMSATLLAKSDVEYALKPKRNCSKKVIDYEKFDFFHNSVLPKNGIKVKIKSLCLKNKYVRKLRLKNKAASIKCLTSKA